MEDEVAALVSVRLLREKYTAYEQSGHRQRFRNVQSRL